MTESWRIY